MIKIIALTLLQLQFIHSFQCSHQYHQGKNIATHVQYTGSQCQPCYYKCTRCSDNSCLDCAQGYYLLNLQCSSCSSGCFKCTNSESCSQCFQGYKLDDDFCTRCFQKSAFQCANNLNAATKCFDQYYLDTQKSECIKCESNCKVCSNSECTDCLQGYYKNNVNNCIKCEQNCEQCNQNRCLQCSIGYITSGSNCRARQNNDINNCIYKYQSRCLECQKGYYWSNQSQTCVYGCSLACQYCWGPLYIHCVTKNQRFYCNQDFQNATASDSVCIPMNISNGLQTDFYTYTNLKQKLQSPLQKTFIQDVAYGGSKVTITFEFTPNPVQEMIVQAKLYLDSNQTKIKTKVTDSGDSNFVDQDKTHDVVPKRIDQNSSSYLIYPTFQFLPISLFTKIEIIPQQGNIYISQLFIKIKRCPGSKCKYCDGSGICLKCKDQNHYLQQTDCQQECQQNFYSQIQQKICYKVCPTSTFTVDATLSCKKCQNNCFSCLDQSTCLSCSKIGGIQYFLNGTNCVNNCQDETYFPNNLTYTCDPCISPCLQCASRDQCKKCKTDFLSSQTGTCLVECEQGYFQFLDSIKGGICKKCDQDCNQCQFDEKQCKSCKQNSYLKQKECISKEACQSTGGYYANDSFCNVCPSQCKGCRVDAENTIKCTSCKTNFYDELTQQCTSTCSNGYYINVKEMICSKCPNGCQICKNNNYCQSCQEYQQENYYLSQQKCLKNCPDFYYGDQASKLCIPCISPCSKCSDVQNCLSCSTNFLKGDKCVPISQCNIGTFGDINTLTCKNCSQNCKTCEFIDTNCLECQAGKLLSGFIGNKTCVTSCSQLDFFFYKNDNQNQCVPCNPPCVTCQNFSQCRTCQVGYIFDKKNKLCLQKCQDGSFLEKVDGIQVCSECEEGCLICDSNTQCITCANQFFLIKDTKKCSDTCPNLTYAAPISHTCQPCVPPCLQCESLTLCKSCQSGYNIQGKCVSFCPNQYFQQKNDCKKCSQNCLACTQSQGKCTYCRENKFLKAQACVDSCGEKYYQNKVQKICLQCQSPCLTCEQSQQKCLSCQDGFLLYENQCYINCPLKTFADGSKCLPCNQNNCYFCKNDTHCLSCVDNFVLSNNKCVQKCDDGSFKNSFSCQKCISPCINCNKTNCLSCVQGFYYDPIISQCLIQCPTGFFQSQSQCLQCSIQCRVCQSETYCIQCLDQQQVAEEGVCKNQCSPGFYESNKFCLPCQGKCSQCKSKYECLKCKDGQGYADLSSFFCYINCPEGTFGNKQSSQCQKCDAICQSCVKNGTTCTSCKAGKFLFLNSCADDCPAGSYKGEGKCLSCKSPCQTCQGSNNCNSCQHGFVLYEGKQCVELPCPNKLFYHVQQSNCVLSEQDCGDLKIDYKNRICSKECRIDFYFLQKGSQQIYDQCVQECPIGYQVDQNLKCILTDQVQIKTLTMIPRIKIRDNLLNIQITFNQQIYWKKQPETQNFQLQFIPYSQETTRILFPRFLQVKPLEFQMTSTEPITLLINTNKTLFDGYFKIKFMNSSDYFRSQLSQIPLYPNYAQKSFSVFYKYTLVQRQTGSILRQISQSMAAVVLLILLILIIKNQVSEIFLILDVLQLIYILRWLNVDYPPNLNGFIQGFSHSMLYFIPNIFQFVFQNTVQNASGKFQTLSTDGNFLRNAGHYFIIFLILIFLFLAFKSIKFQLVFLYFSKQRRGQYWDKIKSNILKIYLRYRWHYTNDFFFITYLCVTLFTISQTIDMSLQQPIMIFNLIVWLITIVAYIAFPIFIAYKLKRHFNNIKRGKNTSNLKCFYRGLIKDNGFGISLIILRYGRKMIFSLSIGLLALSPLYVLPIISTPCLLLLLIFIINKPYRKVLSNIINIITQVLYVIILILISVLKFRQGSDTSQERWIIGWCIVAIGIILILLHGIYIAVKMFFQLEDEQKVKLRVEQKLNKFIEQKYDSQEEDSQNNFDYMDQYGVVYSQSQGSQFKDKDEFMYLFLTRHYSQSDEDENWRRGKQNVPKYLIKCVQQVNDLDQKQ